MNNDKFYDSLSVKVLDEFAKKTFGENPPSDLEKMIKYLKPNRQILEVGAGTGRIGIELIKRDFSYTGIEKYSKFLKVFKSRLKNSKFNPKKVQLLNISYENLPKDKNFDFIIFSWTVIGDFSKKDQIKALKKTYNLLSGKGVCLLDNPSKNQEYNKYGSYNPTPFYYDDWKNLLSDMGFSHESKIYKTKTGVERELTILKKRN